MFEVVWLSIITLIVVSAWVGVLRLHKKAKGREESSKDSFSSERFVDSKLARMIALAVAGILTLFWGWTMLDNLSYRVDPGESAVLKSWTGEVNENAVFSEQGGMHFKAPWENVTTFNVRNQQIVFQPEGGNDTNITASTKDNASVFIDVTLTYNQDAQSVVGIYKTFHTEGEMRAQLIRDARGALQNAPTKFVTMEIKQSRPQLEQAFTVDLREKLEKKYSITLTSVSIRNMWFTDDVQKSLDAVQQRNAEVEQAKAALLSARIKAEVTKTEAKAQADSDQIMRCGAQTEMVEVTDPVTGDKSTEMQVTPIPMDKCQNRLNEQVLTNKYIDALKEIANKQGNVIITDGKTVPIVNIPNAAK